MAPSKESRLATPAHGDALRLRTLFQAAWALYPSQALRIPALLLGWVLVWVVVEVLVIASHSGPGRPIWLVLHLGYFWGTAYWEAAILRCALEALKGKSPPLLRLLPDHRVALRFFGLKLLLLPATLLGTVMLLLPGLYILARYGLAYVFVVDRDCGPRAALTASRRASRGATPRLMLLFLVLLLFNLLGAAFLGVGLLFTVPMTALAVAHLFQVCADPL